MDLWTALADVLVLLLAAILLGGIFERLRQHAILGYLLAGTLLGPNVLAMIPDREAIALIAELGVALLLFMIGLEFSIRRLRSLGAVAAGGGAIQVAAIVGLAVPAGRALGLGTGEAFAAGAVVALSSTAVVMRLLADRTETDSVHGRNVLGILLLQDIAVVPLLLSVTLLAGRGTVLQFGWALARSLGAGLVLAGGLFVILKYLLPRLFRLTDAASNRDLPILLSVVIAMGCAWGAHALSFSPVLGAFVGGIILAESPYALRIHADVAPLKTLFLTLFFTTIGMLVDPGFVASHWPVVAALTAAVLLGKTLVAAAATLPFRTPLRHALATGICLVQLGEFSFVIAEVSRENGLIGAKLFDLMISVTVTTLFLTPFLVALAARVSGRGPRPATTRAEEAARVSGHVVLVGFGPAGETVARQLAGEGHCLVVVEMRIALAKAAERMGIPAVIGDAAQLDILRHADVGSAKAAVVTIPDPATSRRITSQIRSLAPGIPLVVRGRYNRYLDELGRSGASVVVNEEVEVGLRLVSHLQRLLQAG